MMYWKTALKLIVGDDWQTHKGRELTRKTLIKSPAKANTFIEWVRCVGGIYDPALLGELREFTCYECKVRNLVNQKTGQPFDTLVMQAIDDGWLPEESTGDDLRALLRQDIMALRNKGPRMQPLWNWNEGI